MMDQFILDDVTSEHEKNWADWMKKREQKNKELFEKYKEEGWKNIRVRREDDREKSLERYAPMEPHETHMQI